MRPSLLIPAIVVVAACGNTASHLPNPLLLPGQAVATGLENAAYNARRNKVSQHIAEHHATILTEIDQGDGPQLETAISLARIPQARRSALMRVLREDIALYRRDREALVVAFMVHGP